MNYHNITKEDMLNGSGLRVVLWCSGCSHNCPGCQNPSTHDPKSGIIFDESAKKELFDELSKKEIQGITFSGGDPMHIANRKTVANLCEEIKNKFPDKDIWIYTGNYFSDLTFAIDVNSDITKILKYVDIIVDGPFIEKLRDNTYQYAGSTNQTVVDVQSTLSLNDIKL